jgi:hypothetical protein
MEDIMTRYQVVFFADDGINQTDIGAPFGLNADTLEEADGDASAMGPPAGANFYKILDEGKVVKRVGFAL